MQIKHKKTFKTFVIKYINAIDNLLTNVFFFFYFQNCPNDKRKQSKFKFIQYTYLYTRCPKRIYPLRFNPV